MGQMPAKLTDAMLLGLPVLATQISDIPRYLEGCGILLAASTPQSIGNAISLLASNPEDARTIGNAAREQALEYLTFDAMFQRMASEIDRLVLAE